MRKILVYDHRFNVESLSSCQKIDNSVMFYDRITTLSFYDNYDRIKPDELWINEFFCPKDFVENVKKNITIKIITYSVDYILPNIFASITTQYDNIISCILEHGEPEINKIYMYDNTYVRFFTLNNHEINHIQYCGRINSCKELSNIINESSKIILQDSTCVGLCEFYAKHYAYFKPSGTLSWITTQNNQLLTNKDLFFNNVSR